MADLPAELWTQIFDLAADEDVIFHPALPTTMAESVWFKNFFGDWTLRSPQDAIELVQRRSYATKKSIVLTCKRWRDIGAELLFRCLFFTSATRLSALCALLDSTPVSSSSTASHSLGWWTRRIHLTRFNINNTNSNVIDALTTLIRHCPNLEIFILDSFISLDAFSAIADTLTTYNRKSLRTIHFKLPHAALRKAILALEGLPHIFAAQLEFTDDDDASTDDLDSSTSDAGDLDSIAATPHLGSTSSLPLTLPSLHQLHLHGHTHAFLAQATHWSLPALRHLAINCGTHRTLLPDVPAFLVAHNHGTGLRFLDLYSIPAMPVQSILSVCPGLRGLAFNADWRLGLEGDDDTTPPLTHDHITHIGLHGLAYAFGVGLAAAHAEGDPLPALLVGRANDLVVNAVCDKARFPKLERVRVVSGGVLRELERAGGPEGADVVDDRGRGYEYRGGVMGGAAGSGMERWERWWEACSRVGVRLEDCTGGLLGVLPGEGEMGSDEDDDDENDDGSEEEYEEEEYDEEEYEEGDTTNREWKISIPPMEDDEAQPGGGHLTELRKLLEECRAMAEGREVEGGYLHESEETRMMFPEIRVVDVDAGEDV
ncbi:hypothetical protein R3P38DRAFT_3594848 [Favolaschia claudopus]|uniref:F-box domain-containing protein n=1 Tax=Favolaschia claudopus TaxID=2862362 RepID=A0AAW0DKR1_9AGAR